jgi:hypothetical protein
MCARVNQPHATLIGPFWKILEALPLFDCNVLRNITPEEEEAAKALGSILRSRGMPKKDIPDALRRLVRALRKGSKTCPSKRLSRIDHLVDQAGCIEDLIVKQWDKLRGLNRLTYVDRNVQLDRIGFVDILAIDRAIASVVLVQIQGDRKDDETFEWLRRYVSQARQLLPPEFDAYGVILTMEMSSRLKDLLRQHSGPEPIDVYSYRVEGNWHMSKERKPKLIVKVKRETEGIT